MKPALAPPPTCTMRGIVEGIRVFPHAVFAIVIVAVVFCGAVLANVPSSWLPDSAQTLQTAPELLPAAAPPLAERQGAANARRCTTCGVVETIRALEQVGDLPVAYEFTIRLRDGSTRVSTTTGQGTWRAGDRIMLMGGDARPAS